MSRIQEIRAQKGALAADIAHAIGLTAPQYSNIETDKLLPYPVTAKKLCRALGVGLSELYEKSDVRFVFGHDYRSGDKTIVNLSARVPREIRDTLLSEEVLLTLGYASFKDWLTAMARKTRAEYDKIIKETRL